MNERITVHNIISHMEFLAPPERAEEWDHIGLMVGSHQSEVKGVVLSLDVTAEAINICKHTGANLIITHHPLFFTPCFSIDTLTPHGKLIKLLFQGDISVFSAHTNLDCADHSVNHALAGALGLTPDFSSTVSRFGLFCSTKEPVKYVGYSEWIRKKLGSSGVFLNNNEDVDIKNLCLCAGSFDETIIPEIIDTRTDVVITGEIKHHAMIFLNEAGVRVIAAGHEATERVIFNYLKDSIRERFPGITVTIAQGNVF